MRIIVESMNRETVKIYGDNKVLEIMPTNNITVYFVIDVNGSFIDSSIDIESQKDLTFDKVEEIIKDKLLESNVEQ